MKSNNKNSERVSRLLNLFGCKGNSDLAKYLNRAGAKIYRQNICRWKSKGLSPTTETLIDELLNEIDRLKEEIKVNN